MYLEIIFYSLLFSFVFAFFSGYWSFAEWVITSLQIWAFSSLLVCTLAYVWPLFPSNRPETLVAHPRAQIVEETQVEETLPLEVFTLPQADFGSVEFE